MWLLTCDGDVFGGKRLWLRPGSSHLLGRTSGRSEAGERIQYIDHKSVSRKHLLIEVGTVKAGDCSKLHTRSEIKVKDGSKIGTTINGDKFSQETRTLREKEFTIRLGNYEHMFHLWWHPVTLSFIAGVSRKAKGDPLAAQREKFEQTDVKIVSDYLTNDTTHAISKKRNTPHALQALLQARWLVTDEFADALAVAVERRQSDGTSLLEEDFDGNWPKEDEYLLPAGKEPQPRPNEYLRPDPLRAEVFQDYIFVFLSQTQHDTLMPVITSGGGKALLSAVEIGQSKVEDVVAYVKEVAGHKNSKQFRLSQETGKGGVVVVRLNERDEAWREFMRAIDLALDQRSVEQNQFLDAILTVDASGLKKQLEEEPESSNVNEAAKASTSRPRSEPREQQRAITVADSPPPAEHEPQHAQPPGIQDPPSSLPAPEELATKQPSAANKRRNRRIITQSRFKGFDDFDPSQFSKPASQSPQPSFASREPSQPPNDQNMDIDEPSQSTRTQRNSRKRPAPVHEDDENEEDMYASILTGHAAMKRQKTAAGGNNASTRTSATPDGAVAGKAAKDKKKAKEMDVMAEVQARRKREDEKRLEDEKSLKDAMEGVNIGDLKNLAQVEEMELPDREPPARRTNEKGNTDRWDPSWNGRKNFKKFRPQGQQNDGPRLQRVIVTLEEVPRKGHGIGDEYWLNSSSTNRSKSKSKSQSQSQSVRQGAPRSQNAAVDDTEDQNIFRRRLQTSRDEDAENAEAEDVLPEEIAGHARDEGLEAAANANVNSTPSQTLGTASQRKAAGKRPAATQGSVGPAKKARQSRLAAPSREVVALEDDDDDELRFRRRRRG